jgi:RNA polymerase sigma-70 factor (ECF subfamily)
MHDVALMSESQTALATSFEQVFRQRETEILRAAYRIVGNWADAEDVAQETFIRLHKHGVGFPNDMALRSWLYRVAVNLCLDRKRVQRRFEEVPEALAAAGTSAEAGVIREQQKQAVMTALAALPPKERAAVVLREIEGLSTAEVAAILGSSDVTVRSQVAKAIGKLRSLVSGGKQ